MGSFDGVPTACVMAGSGGRSGPSCARTTRGADVIADRSLTSEAVLEALDPTAVRARSLRIGATGRSAAPPRASASLLVTFDTNSTELTGAARRQLDIVASALRNDRLRRVPLHGGRPRRSARQSRQQPEALAGARRERQAVSHGRKELPTIAWWPRAAAIASRCFRPSRLHRRTGASPSSRRSVRREPMRERTTRCEPRPPQPIRGSGAFVRVLLAFVGALGPALGLTHAQHDAGGAVAGSLARSEHRQP